MFVAGNVTGGQVDLKVVPAELVERTDVLTIGGAGYGSDTIAGAFLRATDDGQPGNRFLPAMTGGSILLSEGGSVFQFTGTLPASNPNGSFSAIVGGLQTGALQSVAGNTQAVAGIGAVGNSGEIDIQGRRYQITARARF